MTRKECMRGLEDLLMYIALTAKEDEISSCYPDTHFHDQQCATIRAAMQEIAAIEAKFHIPDPVEKDINELCCKVDDMSQRVNGVGSVGFIIIIIQLVSIMIQLLT